MNIDFAAEIPATTSLDRRFTAQRLRSDDPLLANFTAVTSIFQSQRHIETLLATVGHAVGAEPVLIGVRDDRGVPVALFPLVFRRVFGLRLIEGLDFEVTDYFAPAWLADREPTAAEADAIWAAVLGALPRADAIAFKKMPRLIDDRPHALTAFGRVRQMAATATTLRLPQGFDPHRLSIARDARRKLRKLQGMGDVAFSLAVGPEEIERALMQLVAFRLARFAELDRPDILTRGDVVEYYRRMALGTGAPGLVFTLSVGGEAVASIYALRTRDAFTLIIPAIAPDPKWHAGSPGLVALFHALEWSVAEGHRIFDLSVGSMHYKTRFAADAAELFEYQQALTPAGWLLVAEAALRRSLRAHSRTAPRVRRLLEHFRQTSA